MGPQPAATLVTVQIRILTQIVTGAIKEKDPQKCDRSSDPVQNLFRLWTASPFRVFGNGPVRFRFSGRSCTSRRVLHPRTVNVS